MTDCRILGRAGDARAVVARRTTPLGGASNGTRRDGSPSRKSFIPGRRIVSPSSIRGGSPVVSAQAEIPARSSSQQAARYQGRIEAANAPIDRGARSLAAVRCARLLRLPPIGRSGVIALIFAAPPAPPPRSPWQNHVYRCNAYLTRQNKGNRINLSWGFSCGSPPLARRHKGVMYPYRGVTRTSRGLLVTAEAGTRDV